MIKFEKGITDDNKGYGMPEPIKKLALDFDPELFDLIWTEDGGVEIECVDPSPTPEMMEELWDFLDAWREWQAL